MGEGGKDGESEGGRDGRGLARWREGGGESSVVGCGTDIIEAPREQQSQN